MTSQFWRKSSKGGYAAQMAASFPDIIAPSDELFAFFEWQESNGLVLEEDGGLFALLDPDQTDSSMYTMPVDQRYAQTWYGKTDRSVQDRIAPFFRSGGDGSVVALWKDDKGELAFVHMGSGSGSTALGILTRKPVDFLRLIAIGYDELCWPEWYSLTPQQAWANATADLDLSAYQKRHRLKEWVEKHFGAMVPDTASAIVSDISGMDDAKSNDEFWIWNRTNQGWGLN